MGSPMKTPRETQMGNPKETQAATPQQRPRSRRCQRRLSGHRLRLRSQENVLEKRRRPLDRLELPLRMLHQMPTKKEHWAHKGATRRNRGHWQ